MGILIYEMIVGLPPFYSKDTKAAYQRLLTEPLQFKDHVSQAARELIKGLLNTDPNKRLGAVPKDRSKQSNSDSHTTSMLSQVNLSVWPCLCVCPCRLRQARGKPPRATRFQP